MRLSVLAHAEQPSAKSQVCCAMTLQNLQCESIPAMKGIHVTECFSIPMPHASSSSIGSTPFGFPCSRSWRGPTARPLHQTTPVKDIPVHNGGVVREVLRFPEDALRLPGQIWVYNSQSFTDPATQQSSKKYFSLQKDKHRKIRRDKRETAKQNLFICVRRDIAKCTARNTKLFARPFAMLSHATTSLASCIHLLHDL